MPASTKRSADLQVAHLDWNCRAVVWATRKDAEMGAACDKAKRGRRIVSEVLALDEGPKTDFGYLVWTPPRARR